MKKSAMRSFLGRVSEAGDEYREASSRCITGRRADVSEGTSIIDLTLMPFSSIIDLELGRL